jgi:hypothetical protein
VTSGAIESAQKALKVIETTLDKPVSRSTIQKKKLKNPLFHTYKQLTLEFAKNEICSFLTGKRFRWY